MTELSGLLKIWDFFKQPARVLFVIGIVGLLVLFLPERAANTFGFVYLRTRYLPWISLVTLVCLGIGFVGLAKILIDKFWIWKRHQHLRTAFVSHLDSLSSQERFYLAYCLSRNTTTIHLRLIDAAAGALCAKGILYKVPGAHSILAWPHLVLPLVWEYLRLHSSEIAQPEEFDQLEGQFRSFEDQMRRDMF